MALGIDVGGTFTDVVTTAGGQITVTKVSTTADQSVGVLEGARRAGAHSEPLLVHGTTAATNALLERAGGRVVLVTDAGLVDAIEIGRSDRPSLYDTMSDRSEPLVPRERRLGSDLPDLVGSVAALSPQVVVVGLKGSYADPGPEDRLVDLLNDGLGDVEVVASHRIANEFREFERLSTAVTAAYLRPSVGEYLRNLTVAVVPEVAERLLVMRSSGGVAPAEPAAENPTTILLSGPAGGVAATRELARRLGLDRVVSFDMGGTSTDVCRIEGGEAVLRHLTEIDGYPCLAPAVAIHTVGAGGGSVAWVDAGGALRVGPRSAGADPGPAGYGRGGTEPTVTDANIVLGRIDPSAVFGDGVAIDADASLRAVAGLGARVGLEPVDAALGIIEVVEAHMERAIHTVSVREGYDLRDAALVAFGGAGALHAAAIAERLELGSVIVPRHAGVFSAVGLLMSPARFDVVRPSTDLGVVAFASLFETATTEAEERFFGAIGSAPLRFESSADMRYAGQSHETRVAIPDGADTVELVAAFHREHRTRNGFDREGDPVELVAVRVAAIGAPALESLPSRFEPGTRSVGRRTVWEPRGPSTVAVHPRAGLAAGEVIEGPAVIEDEGSTIWVPGDHRASVLDSGELEMRR